MQTLDLSIALQPTDGLLKRLFWPTIRNRRDVDLIGRQGFWVCFVVAFVWTVGSFFTAHPSLGLLVGITYFFAAFGIREQSIAAAVLAFLCLFLDRVASLEALLLGVPGGGNPKVGIVAMVLLFLNIRATILSRQWLSRKASPEIREQPERPAASFTDKLVNQWPHILWPRTRYVFYPLAAIVILTSISAFFGLPQISEKQVNIKPAGAEMAVTLSR